MARKINPVKYRKLSLAELAKFGATRKSERYVRASTKRVTKKTPTISRRAYEQARLGTTLEKAVKQRQSGERSYKSEATKEAAQKQRGTRQAMALALKFTATFEQRTRSRNITHLHPPPRRYTRAAHARSYRFRDEMRYYLPALRARKLKGEYLENWDAWKNLVDFARRINDPALPLLLKS
jgi:hypothetical protein